MSDAHVASACQPHQVLKLLIAGLVGRPSHRAPRQRRPASALSHQCARHQLGGKWNKSGTATTARFEGKAAGY